MRFFKLLFLINVCVFYLHYMKTRLHFSFGVTFRNSWCRLLLLSMPFIYNREDTTSFPPPFFPSLLFGFLFFNVLCICHLNCDIYETWSLTLSSSLIRYQWKIKRQTYLHSWCCGIIYEFITCSLRRCTKWLQRLAHRILGCFVGSVCGFPIRLAISHFPFE